MSVKREEFESSKCSNAPAELPIPATATRVTMSYELPEDRDPVNFALMVMADTQQDVSIRLAAAGLAARHMCPVPLATRGDKEVYNASDWAAVVERLILAKFPRETWPQQALLEYQRNPEKYGSDA